MNLLSKFTSDPLFTKIIRSSGSLLSNNTIALGLSVIQGIMATRLLGPAGFGLIGVVMAFASTVNSIFSFRMSELVVRYGGEYLNKDDKQNASALLKLASYTEAFVSLIAFLIVLVTATFAEMYLAKTSDVAWMFIVYAIGLLANFNTETATGILQITDKIKWQGTINLIQAIFTTLIIAGAFFFNGNITIVLIAYLVGKSIMGLGLFITAQIQLIKKLGGNYFQTPISNLKSIKEIIRFAFSSNISATIIKVFRESEMIWVGLFLDTTAVGYYRVAYTITHFLAIPADPLIATTFPEINRLAVEKAWGKLKSFLRKVTAFSFAYNILLGIALIVFGKFIISIYSGDEYLNAYPALVALTIGLVFNYILFWNRPLLLALGLPQFPIYVTLIVGLIKLALSFVLVANYGIVAAGALLSFYYIASVGIMVIRGIVEIKKKEENGVTLSDSEGSLR
ncbi:MAG: oligosaccharide flippase family protein [Anaerolineales bacterium]|nr:oligosaccharide flippase family protein [Anaerolineales bacterium]